MESNGVDGLAGDEIEAVKTLIGLEETHVKTWHFKWGRRRKRSALDEAAAPLAIRQADKPAVGGSAGPETEVRPSNSPVSPLEFAGVSDEKDNPRPSKAAKIMTRKDWEEMIQQLTKTKQVLIGEIENVRKGRNELLVQNSELKATKEKALNKKEEPQTAMNFAAELSQHYQTPTAMPHHHRQPYIPDPTAGNLHFSAGPEAHELGSSNRVGPRRFDFDLNLPPEEYFAASACASVEAPQPSDEMMQMADRRARSADARRRRKGMMKIKNMRSACGIKLLPSDE